MSKKVENLEVVEMDEVEVIEEENEVTNENAKEKNFFNTALSAGKKFVIPVLAFVGGIALGKLTAGATKEITVTDVIEAAEDVVEF